MPLTTLANQFPDILSMIVDQAILLHISKEIGVNRLLKLIQLWMNAYSYFNKSVLEFRKRKTISFSLDDLSSRLSR